MPRQSITKKVEAEVLTRCRRRCCLCYAMDGDLSSKKGQIAHIDRDHANSAAGNLVYLCLAHHDEYDSRPSQSKGYVAAEVRIYRANLLQAIKVEKHLTKRTTRPRVRQKDPTTADEPILTPSPDAIILAAWVEIENALTRRVNAIVNRVDSNKPMDLGLMIALLTRMGYVDVSVSSTLHELWHLRNHVAHLRQPKLTKKDASDYCKRAANVVVAMTTIG